MRAFTSGSRRVATPRARRSGIQIGVGDHQGGSRGSDGVGVLWSGGRRPPRDTGPAAPALPGPVPPPPIHPLGRRRRPQPPGPEGNRPGRGTPGTTGLTPGPARRLATLAYSRSPVTCRIWNDVSHMGEGPHTGLVQGVRAQAASEDQQHLPVRRQLEPGQPLLSGGGQESRAERSSRVDVLPADAPGVGEGEADLVHHPAEDAVRPAHVRVHLHGHRWDPAKSGFGHHRT